MTAKKIGAQNAKSQKLPRRRKKPSFRCEIFRAGIHGAFAHNMQAGRRKSKPYKKRPSFPTGKKRSSIFSTGKKRPSFPTGKQVREEPVAFMTALAMKSVRRPKNMYRARNFRPTNYWLDVSAKKEPTAYMKALAKMRSKIRRAKTTSDITPEPRLTANSMR